MSDSWVARQQGMPLTLLSPMRTHANYPSVVCYLDAPWPS
jgi:hypothetical protein